MSTSSTTNTHSPHSQGTPATPASPEFLHAFNNLTLAANDPFVNHPVQAPAANAAAVARPVRLARPVFDYARLVDDNNLDLRRHGGRRMGSSRNGSEAITQFILVDDIQSIAEYSPGGALNSVLLLNSQWEYCFDPKHPHPETGRFKVLLRYSNTNDVELALEILRRQGLNAYCISAKRFCVIYADLNAGVVAPGCMLSRCGPELPTLDILGTTFVGGYDGQLMVQAEWNRNMPITAEAHGHLILDVVKDLFTNIYGEHARIRSADAVVAPRNPNIMGFVIELHEHKVADHLVAYFGKWSTGLTSEGITVTVMHYQREVFDGPSGGDPRNGDPHLAIRRRFLAPHNRYDHPNFAATGNGQSRPYSQLVSPIRQTRDRRYREFGPHGRYGDPRATVGTQVKWTAVFYGEDTRTTFMLRNIPAEMTYGTLKKFVDGFLKSKYDFMYLRVDFKSKVNLGYAFINVGKPEYIIPFLNACEGAYWPIPGCNKSVEVSYATLQGVESLVHKFRNSAVMLKKDYNCRPHLYWLAEDSPYLAGLEREFPGPDNCQKQMRSEQNAINFGLYAPGKGGRRGKYDRGYPGGDFFGAMDNRRCPYQSFQPLVYYG